MPEEWRPIKGHEGKYEVSNRGQVKTLKRIHVAKDTIMSEHTHWKGYKCVWLRSPGKHQKAFIHRLVAEAFIPNIDDKPIVNHKDGNKANNDLSNLEWCTDSENQLHWRHELRPKISVPCIDIDPAEVPF